MRHSLSSCNSEFDVNFIYFTTNDLVHDFIPQVQISSSLIDDAGCALTVSVIYQPSAMSAFNRYHFAFLAQYYLTSKL